MPIYEYRRPDGSTFEVQQSFSDDALKVDPETGVPVERVLHPPAVHFKGKGFYNTDYGTRSRQRENAAAAAAEKSSGEGSSAQKSSGEGAQKSAGAGSGSQKSSADGKSKSAGGEQKAPKAAAGTS
jgi:putative FmdB family regulatory protein